MNCEKFESLITEIARGDLHDAKLRQEASRHAASCPHCDELLTEALALDASLSALAAHDKPAQSPAHMESSLRAAFVREHAGRLDSPKAAPAARTTPRWIFAGAAIAATVLLAVLLVPRWLRLKAPDQNVAVVPPVTGALKIAPPAPSVITPATQSSPAIKPKSPGVRLVVHRANRLPLQPEKTLTGFLLLPFADDPSTIRSGTVVRLTMSRSDLAWLGFPVTISATAQSTVADLFVNESGTPEAIRLVR